MTRLGGGASLLLVAILGGTAVVTLSACGARSSIAQGSASGGAAGRSGAGGGGNAGAAGKVVEAECSRSADCDGFDNLCSPVACREGRCVAGSARVCSDGDPCTADKCDPATGACSFPPSTLDLDGDGFRGPLPGFLAGQPGACGNDCDDTSKAAFPGGVELCDGVDNDCNGIIDDNASFIPLDGSTLVSDPASVLAGAGGLGSTSSGFLATINAQDADDTKIYARPLDATGKPAAAASLVNPTTGDASGGPLVFTGDRFGLAWEDRRSGDYEIYFATLGPDGKKLRQDVRLTDAADFSVNPTIGWNGTTFSVVWQDRRSGDFTLRGQKLDLDGNKIGDDVPIVTSPGEDVESPSLAVSTSGTALAYRTGDSESSRVQVRILDDNLKLVGTATTLAENGRFEAVSVVPNGSDFLVTWGARDPFRIFGAILNKQGTVLVAPREISPPGGQSRIGVPVALGDRFVMVFGRVGSSGYDLFSLTLDQKLTATGPAALVSAGVGDELPSSVALGAKGSIGVLYNGKIPDPKGGVKGAAFFSRLECRGSSTTTPPP